MSIENGTNCVCCGKALNFISGNNKLLESEEKAVCSSCFSEFGVSYNIFSKTAAPEKLKMNYEAALRDIRDAGFKPDAQNYLLVAAEKRYREKTEELKNGPVKKKPAAPAPKPEAPAPALHAMKAGPEKPALPAHKPEGSGAVSPGPKAEGEKSFFHGPKPAEGKKPADAATAQKPMEMPGEKPFLMTTGKKPEGFGIRAYHGVCFALAVISAPEPLEKGDASRGFAAARERALSELKEQALKQGADSLTELAMDIKSAGEGKLALLFSGNAVSLKPE